MDSLLSAVREALAREPRLDLQRHPIRLWWEWNDLGMAGEVPNVASKKLALERAAAVPGVDRIIDELHIIPDRRLPDRQVNGPLPYPAPHGSTAWAGVFLKGLRGLSSAPGSLLGRPLSALLLSSSAPALTLHTASIPPVRDVRCPSDRA